MSRADAEGPRHAPRDSAPGNPLQRRGRPGGEQVPGRRRLHGPREDPFADLPGTVAALRRSTGHLVPWLFLSLAAGVGPAQAGSPSMAAAGSRADTAATDDRVAVNGRRWPWRAIGYVERRIGGRCTGTLVGPRAVLTAAHCLFDPRTGRQLEPSDVRFVTAARDGGTAPGASAEDFVVHSPHGQSRPTIADMKTDWALIVLREPLATRPLRVGHLPGATRESMTTGEQRVARVGYGWGRPDELNVFRSCRILRRDPEDRLMFTDCDTIRGDSGSPLLINSTNGPVVVGVVSGRIQNRDGRSGTVAVSAGPILESLSRRDLAALGLGDLPTASAWPSGRP